MCKSLALEIRFTSPMLAALSITSPPDLKVSDVVATHIHVAAIEFEFVTANCESSRTIVLNGSDVFKSLFN